MSYSRPTRSAPQPPGSSYQFPKTSIDPYNPSGAVVPHYSPLSVGLPPYGAISTTSFTPAYTPVGGASYTSSIPVGLMSNSARNPYAALLPSFAPVTLTLPNPSTSAGQNTFTLNLNLATSSSLSASAPSPNTAPLATKTVLNPLDSHAPNKRPLSGSTNGEASSALCPAHSNSNGPLPSPLSSSPLSSPPSSKAPSPRQLPLSAPTPTIPYQIPKVPHMHVQEPEHAKPFNTSNEVWYVVHRKAWWCSYDVLVQEANTSVNNQLLPFVRKIL